MGYGGKKRGRGRRGGKAKRGKGVFGRYSKRGLVARAKNKRLAKAIKGTILKTSETKYKSVNMTTSAQYYHDQLHKTSIWDTSNHNIFPVQGSSDGERIGEEIYTQGIKIRATFRWPYDRKNGSVKFWYVPCNSVQGDPASADFQHAITGNLWIDPVQYKRWPGMKYLGKCRALQNLGNPDFPDGSTHGFATMFKTFWIPMRKKLKFINDGSSVPANLKEQGYIVALAYDHTGALTTDIVIDDVEMVATLYYKDP